MKMLLFVFTLGALVGCSSKNESLETDPSAIVFLQEQDRALLRDTWINDADTVAEKTKNNVARIIVEFIKQNNVLAEPHSNTVWLLEEPIYSDTEFLLIPIVFGDHMISEVWEKFHTPNSAGIAHFMPMERFIIIKSHIPFSRSWRGIILLHEAFHAHQYTSKPYDWTDDNIFCMHEMQAHEFQNRIVSSLGGAEYELLLESIVQVIRQNHKSSNVNEILHENLYHRNRNYDELDSIFGKSENKLEADFRSTSTWIHAYFVFFEMNFPKESQQYKMAFLRQLYLSGGIIGEH